jgi:lipopolysaccharide export system protein LptA
VTTYSAQSVVFIDSRVPDLQDLLNGLQPGEQAFLIDPSSDGIQQIADILAENNLTDLSSISIVSHGESGALELGSSFITDGNLAGHSNALAEIGASLAPGAAIQLYGCDVALGTGGQQFINDFSVLAGGAAVEASTHIVGSAALGGSWTLDASSNGANGTPVASAPFTPAALANFQGDLAAPVQTEVWISATGGGNDSALVHADDTGNGTGTNAVTLFHESLAGNPSPNYPASLSNLTNVALDTQDNLYFLAEQGEGDGSNTPGNNPNVIWVGTLSTELSNPTGTPTLTSIYSQGGSVATTGVITGLALDPASKEVFFTEHQSLLEVAYTGGTVVTLATGGSNVFADGLALDAPHNQAFFFSNTTSSSFSGTVVTSNAIYVDSDLTVPNSTPTQIQLSPADSNLGGGNFPASLGLITGIAVDTKTEKLYFTTQPITDPVATTTGTGGIYEYDLSQGTSGTYNVIWLEPSSGSLFLSYIQIDDATNKYYVTGNQSGDANPSVYDGALSGGTAAQSPTLFADLTMTSITQNVQGLALDNAPTLALTASSPTWTEDGANASLVSSAAATDSDNTSLVSATVSITGGLRAGDTLTFSTAGTSITGSYNSSTGVLTFSGVDSLADYQTVLDSVQYHGGENPTDFSRTDTSRTLSWTVNDGLLTSAPQTSSVSVIFVNDPPTLSGLTTAPWTEEGSAATLSPSASVSDPDDLNLSSATVQITGGTFAGDGDVLSANTSGTNVTASYNAATETLTLSGTDTLAHYQAVLDKITFSAGENPTDFGSDPTRTVTWVLTDPSGTASGGSNTTTTTSTINVIAVNDAPTLTNVAASAQYTEEGPFTTLSGAVTVTDPDDINLSSATVKITGGTFAGDGDVLAATTAGTNITASYNASTETLTLSGTDSVANYQAVLDSVTFHAGENPTNFGSNPTRTITWQAMDPSGTLNGGSDTSTLSTTTLAITNVNDAPTLALGSTVASWTEEQAATSLAPAATVSDPDNLTLASATVAITGGTFAGDGDVLAATTAGTNITASYNSSTETLTLTGSDTLADYQAVLNSVTFSAGENPTDFGSAPARTLTWTLNDGSAASPAQTSTINVTFVNDPPTLANVAASAQYTEEGGAVTLSPSTSISDADDQTLSSATVRITGGTFAGDGDMLAANTTGTLITANYNSSTETLTLTGTDTLAHYQSVLDSVTFQAGENPTNFGSNPTRTITWQALDPSGTANGGSNTSTLATTTVAVTNVNDPPTLSNVAASATFTQGGGAVTLSGAASASDPDNLTLVAATVAVTAGTFVGDGDVLAANTTGTAITASYNAATETLSLTGSDTLAHYSQVLDSVTFTSTSGNPTDFGSFPTRAVTWVVNDGSASFNLSAARTETVSIVANNQPPTLTGVAASASFTEESAATTLSGNVTVSDPDDTTLTGATVSITGGTFAGDGDVLATNTAGTGITASYNSSTETLTLTGTDTLAHYQSVLDKVTFSAGENPTDYGSNPTRTLTWVLNDGRATNNLSTARTETVNVTNVNDPPTLSNVAVTDNFHPQHTITISPSLQVSDPDNLKLANATVAITAGSFAGDGDVLAANTTGTLITANYNSSTETLTLSGTDTLAHYQSVLDSVTFASGHNPQNGNHNRTRTVTWTVNDGGSSNNLATATTTISINDPSHSQGNSADALSSSPSSAVSATSSVSGLSDVAWQSDPSTLSALTLPTSPVLSTGSGNLGGDLLWTGTSAGPPVAGGTTHLSAPDSVGGTAFGGGTQGMPTLTMAANDPLPFASGGSGLGGSLQFNQPPTFAIR